MDRPRLICLPRQLLIEMCAGVRLRKMRSWDVVVDTSNVVVEPYLWPVPGAGAHVAQSSFVGRCMSRPRLSLAALAKRFNRIGVSGTSLSSA